MSTKSSRRRRNDRASRARRDALCTESVQINKCLCCNTLLSTIHTNIFPNPFPSRQLGTSARRRQITPRNPLGARFAAASSDSTRTFQAGAEQHIEHHTQS